MTIAAATASAVSASVGVNQQIAALPAGALPSQAFFSASEADTSGATAVSDLGWSSFVDDHSIQVGLDADAMVLGSATAHATSGPHEVLVTFTSPTPLPIAFEHERYVAGTPGNPLPVAQVDFGDDGLVELDATSPTVVPVVAVVGPTPFVVRCQIRAAVVGSGHVAASLRLTGRPGNAHVRRSGAVAQWRSGARCGLARRGLRSSVRAA